MFKLFNNKSKSLSNFSTIINEDITVMGSVNAREGSILVHGDITQDLFSVGEIQISSNNCSVKSIIAKKVIIDGWLSDCATIEADEVVITNRIKQALNIKNIRYKTLSIEPGAVLKNTVLEYIGDQ